MADDFYSKWGLTSADAPAAPDVGVGQTKSYSEPDFNSKWLGEEQSSSNTAQTVPTTNADRLWQVWNDPYAALKRFGSNITNPEKLQETTIGGIASNVAKTAAQGLTAPGDALKSTPENPVTTEQMVGPATNLASIIGTGAIPSVYGAAKPLIDPATASLASLARDTYGIPIRGGQISESQTVNYLDSVLKGKPFSGYSDNVAAQHSAFNSAIANTIGENAEKVTPEVMANAKQRLGQNYEDIARQTTLKLDDQLGQDFNRIASDAQSVLAPSERSIIHSQIGNILDKAQGAGEIDGKTFQALIRTGSPLDRATKSADTNVKYYAGQVKEALVDAMGRHAPDDMQALLKQTNAQYKAMKTIEPLVTKSPTGDISAPLLMGAVRNKYPNMAYGAGGPLADLARIGQKFLKEPPQSGTAPRLSVSNMLGLGGLGLGEGAALYFHDPVLGAKVAALGGLGMLGKAAVNRGVGSALRSDWYANKLINSAQPGTGGANMLQKLTNSSAPYLPPAAMQPFTLPMYQQQ